MTKCLDRFVGEICLIDEVDGMYTTKGNKELMHNFLDDIKKVNSKTVVIMTTNHFDKLENTPLVRPGRVDKILHIGPCTEKDIEAYVSKTKIELSRVTERLEKPYTMAQAGQIVKDLYMQDLLDKLENS
jgi:SpoVK/Ycf46/Vps4 family AAA+-type ATPase